MRIPEKPPNPAPAINEWSKSPISMADPAVTAFIRSANDRYLHWDKLRFQPLPAGITTSQAWAAVFLSRRMQRQGIPLTFEGDKKLCYWIPPQHHEWISLIDQRAGGFIGSGSEEVPDDNDRYLFNSLMEEAIASSRLEGASTTREVAKEMLRTNRRPRNKAEQMIVNNYKAILEIRDLKKEKLTPQLLCHLQEVLTDQTLDKPDAAGRFRRADEPICVEDATTGESIYDPPPASVVEDRIQELCAFANEKPVQFLHPVLKAIALHFTIGFIHPFVDGNGRTARAVFYWYMLKSGYWLFEYLPISRIIIGAPVKYSMAYLYTETDGGDLTYFNHYHLNVVIRAINELHAYLAQQQRLIEEGQALLEAYPQLNYRQRLVIQDALRHPNKYYTVREHEGEFRVTYNTARSDLIGLVGAGLLERIKPGKEAMYRAPRNLVARLKTPAAEMKPKRRAVKPKTKPPRAPRKPSGTSRPTGPGLFNMDPDNE
jgi:Fic family protein